MSTDLRGLPLLNAAIEHIEQHPETWTQSDYRCGSGKCLAGWIGELAGGQWATGPEHYRAEWMLAEPGDNPRDVSDTDYGEIIHVAERAQRLIGVSRYMSGYPDTGRDLFYGGNSLDDIKVMRDELYAAAIDRAEEEAGR